MAENIIDYVWAIIGLAVLTGIGILGKFIYEKIDSKSSAAANAIKDKLNNYEKALSTAFTPLYTLACQLGIDVKGDSTAVNYKETVKNDLIKIRDTYNNNVSLLIAYEGPCTFSFINYIGILTLLINAYSSEAKITDDVILKTSSFVGDVIDDYVDFMKLYNAAKEESNRTEVNDSSSKQEKAQKFADSLQKFAGTVLNIFYNPVKTKLLKEYPKLNGVSVEV
jgi:hypothetical protein